MMKKRYLVALGAVSSALLAGCSGEIGSPDPLPPGTPVDPGTAGNSATTGATPGAGGSTGPEQGGTPPVGQGGTTGVGQGGTTAATGGTTTGGTGGTPAGGAASTCVPGIPATSQIPRLLNRQYDAVMRDLLGVTTLAGNGNLAPSSGLYADYDGPMNADSWRFYQDVAAMIASEVMAGANKSMFIACDPAAAGCLSDTIRTFGRKAFRRPLTDAEVARFEKLGQTTPAGTAAEVAQTTLEAFLVSPSFLQITELAQTADPAGSGSLELSSYEVAARLSFLLWGSIPDDTLSQAADTNQLTTKEQILAQAQRMIAIREKTAPLVAGYHRTYLSMNNEDAHWWKVDHDLTKYPLYPADAKTVFAAELDRFFEDVAFQGGSFKDLFLSNVGYVNNETAPIYGLDPAAYTADLTRVELDPTTRPGFLTRLAFLSSYSHYDSSSPILRGAFITVNIIGLNPGAPDPNFFLQEAPPGTYYTERQYVDALTSQAACAGCHLPFINPPGYVLENFDSIGGWQTVDPRANGDAATGTIDSTADVTFSTGNTKTITNPLEMMTEIANLPMAKRIYAEKWVSFATGRLPNQNDACLVDTIDVKLAQDGYTVLNLLADLTQSDSFRLRVRGN